MQDRRRKISRGDSRFGDDDSEFGYGDNRNHLADQGRYSSKSSRISQLVANSCSEQTQHVCRMLVNPQADDSIGRFIFQSWTVIFSVLMVASIIVQVYTNIDQTKIQAEQNDQIKHISMVSLEMYDINYYLLDEMEVMFLYSNQSYDVYMQQGLMPTKAVDSKLLWNDNWPSPQDLTILRFADRANVSTPDSLRSAIRATRDLRKTSEISEADILKFYATIMDNLAQTARSMILRSPSYLGYQDLLAVAPIWQTYVSFKKYAFVGRKLCLENRKITSFADETYRLFIEYYTRYNNFATIMQYHSEFARQQILNATSLDVFKDVESLYNLATGMDFSIISDDTWNTVTSKYLAALSFVLFASRKRVTELVKMESSGRAHIDITSDVLLAISGTVVLAAIVAHLFATWNLLRRIDIYHENLTSLKEAMSLLNNYVPPGFVNTGLRTMVSDSRLRYSEDACIMFLDIYNIETLVATTESAELVNLFNRYFELIEIGLTKYGCFKMEVYWDIFALASGMGEYHVIDHVAEMAMLAMQIQDNSVKLGEELGIAIGLKIGMHCGPCYGRLLVLQVPRMIMFGETIHTAAIVHCNSLPLKTLISSAVHDRIVEKSDDMKFSYRGIIDPGDEEGKGKGKIEAYWILSADEFALDEAIDKASIATTTSDLKAQMEAYRKAL